jgi:hypothetical protein
MYGQGWTAETTGGIALFFHSFEAKGGIKEEEKSSERTLCL